MDQKKHNKKFQSKDFSSISTMEDGVSGLHQSLYESLLPHHSRVMSNLEKNLNCFRNLDHDNGGLRQIVQSYGYPASDDCEPNFADAIRVGEQKKPNKKHLARDIPSMSSMEGAATAGLYQNFPHGFLPHPSKVRNMEKDLYPPRNSEFPTGAMLPTFHRGYLPSSSFENESRPIEDEYASNAYGLATENTRDEPLDLGIYKLKERSFGGEREHQRENSADRCQEHEYEHQPCLSPDISCEPSTSGANASKKKKEPSCSLCFNHNIKVPMKGHKHFCPKAQCTCENCVVTRKRQHYMKLQQQNTRRKNQEREKVSEIGAYSLPEPTPEVCPDALTFEYPKHRLFQMKEDLADDPTEFLKEVDKICKPKKN